MAACGFQGPCRGSADVRHGSQPGESSGVWPLRYSPSFATDRRRRCQNWCQRMRMPDAHAGCTLLSGDPARPPTRQAGAQPPHRGGRQPQHVAPIAHLSAPPLAALLGQGLRLATQAITRRSLGALRELLWLSLASRASNPCTRANSAPICSRRRRSRPRVQRCARLASCLQTTPAPRVGPTFDRLSAQEPCSRRLGSVGLPTWLKR